MKNNTQEISDCEYMENFMNEDITRFTTGAIKTGFSNLDRHCESLYPGLYVIAAAPSIGVTTFCGQLADQLAAQKRDVLFFSFEESCLDFVSKSIARIQAQTNLKNKDDQFVSSLAFKMGRESQAENDALNKYNNEIAPHMYIIECYSMSYDYIKGYIEEFIQVHSADSSNCPIQPVIIIDGLQAIDPPETGRIYQSIKESVDTTVTALKCLSREYFLTIITTCYTNRTSYLVPIEFESLKESGNIEISADVVWGLQLECLTTDPIFTENDGNKNKTKKRKIVQDEKTRNPRNVTLTCLKNRFGISSYECYFKYDCTRDLFTEDGYKLPINRSEGVKI